jgi:glutathione S-transferase
VVEVSAEMEELILHHYDFSPFSEKVRLIFAIKSLPWRSVTIPPFLPKPDLVALTGGYRHTPVMQIRADLYCDTRLIATELDRRFPTRPLLHPQSSGLALAVEAWAERDLFWPIARYVSGINAESVDPDLHADRAALRGNSPIQWTTTPDWAAPLLSVLTNTVLKRSLANSYFWIETNWPCAAWANRSVKSWSTFRGSATP